MTAGLLDMARTFVIGVPGTGPITFGAAVPDYQTWVAAGAIDGTPYTYRIFDGNQWEVGTGTFAAAGPALSRGPLFSSAPGNVAIQVTAQAQIACVALASSFSDAAPLTVTGGGGTVTNVSALSITSGGTVSSGGSGVALLAISGGGGGGSYTAGLGLYLTTGTFGNTGTIVQPVDTGQGISLYASSGTGTINGSNVQIGGGAAGTAGYGGGYVFATGGGGPNGASGGASFAMYGGAAAQGGHLSFYSGNGNADGVAGGDFFFNGGSGTNGNAGSMFFRAGNQTGTSAGAGDITFSPGTGPVSGKLVITNLGTVDPHILNVAWLGVGNGITLSSG